MTDFDRKIIENFPGKIVRKEHIDLHRRLCNIIYCKNPRCITSCEQELAHTFKLTDAEKHVYRCMYCDTKASFNQ